MIDDARYEGMTMAAQTGKTSTKRDTDTVRTTTTSVAPTGQSVDRSAEPAQPTPPKPAPRPAPSARSGIRLNAGVVLAAVETGESSRAVKAIQYALADRGFDPGTRNGHFDQGTKNAYARFQDSIRETDDGVPTEESLDYLGFDLI